jgi:hypothetical protein
VDLRDYSIEDLDSQIGVIFQDFMRYEFTARENIAVGRIEAAGEDLVHQAAQMSLADQVIRKLPQGYEQLLGSVNWHPNRIEESEHSLSIGNDMRPLSMRRPTQTAPISSDIGSYLNAASPARCRNAPAKLLVPESD